MITILSTLSIATVSFLIGKYSERLQWNKLIKSGRIPRPSNSKLHHNKYWANN
jgi:hypothetical protein